MSQTGDLPKGTACVKGLNLGANSNSDVSTNTFFTFWI